jgi:hypothetical protein
MQFYAMERFLYRLSQLKESASFVLKGGIMSVCCGWAVNAV